MKLSFLLKICAFTVFLGRAYEFYFFGAPFRAFLWDESLMTPIVEGLSNYSWRDYATSLTVNHWIDGFARLNSIIFLLAAVICLIWDKIPYIKLKKYILGTAILLFFVFGICVVKDTNYDFLQMFELSMQFAAPLLLYFNSNLDLLNNQSNLIFLKITIALAFIPHGMFAMGLIFVPGNFIDMTIKILGVNETQATNFLFVVGFLDILFSVLMFLPRIAKYVLLYMVVWGFLTALARLVAGYNYNFIGSSIHASAYLFIYRISHGLVPLLAYRMEQLKKKPALIFSVNEN